MFHFSKINAHFKFLFVASSFFFILQIANAANVSIKGEQILLDEKPFQIKGVALNKVLQFDLLKGLGANTVRTYGGQEIAAVLDAAQEMGFKVIAGLWIRTTHQGLDYTNQTAIGEELANSVTPFVRQYRDHPALLFWGVGNEMELTVEPKDWPIIWAVIERAAKLVHQLDPAHPTMAVLAEIVNEKAASFVKAVSSIDILGINSYGPGVTTVKQRALAQHWTGPVLITEFGPIGQWQANTTEWGAPLEPSSDEKAEMLDAQMQKLKYQQQDGLAFYWGNKYEATFTWHNLLMPSPGLQYLRTSEVLAKNWGGHLLNHAPRLKAMWKTTQNKWNKFKIGENGTVELTLSDPESNKITVNYIVAAENSDTVPSTFPDVVVEIAEKTVQVLTSNLATGNYRLYITGTDGNGAAATANLPFQVNS